MCTEVYSLFSDTDCRHKEYQNTFPCHIARRCHPDDDQVLKEPIFLPARPPNVPPGLLGCMVRRATRPRTGKCRGCTRKQLRATQGNRDDSNGVVEAIRPSTSPSASTSSTRSEKYTSKTAQILLNNARHWNE
ncbi:hypothetical protein GGR51DRAFT_516972 [Nemania sp. FL0031]|nr:hypothetical protein GGR51DRAFT_516972 [Nemania sp. FL0031]